MQKSEQRKRNRDPSEMPPGKTNKEKKAKGNATAAATTSAAAADDELVKVTDEDKEKEMTARAQALLNDIYDNKEVDPQECAKAQLFLGFNCRAHIKSLNDSLNEFRETYDDKIEEIDQRLDELEMRNRELEMLLVSKDLIVRKLPLHEDAQNDKETNAETIHQLDKFFKAIKFDLQPFEFPECHRMPAKKDIPDDQKKAPIVLLRFPFYKHVRMFFQCLANESAKTEYKNINVENSIPKSLKLDYDRANAKAFELRKSKKNWKTKIEISKSGAITLSTRMKGFGKTWSTVPF